MTVQISDTTLTTHAIRPTALGHALLSYLLGGCVSVTQSMTASGRKRRGSKPAFGSNSTNRSKVCGRYAIATQ
jgi:hypothetical protein